MTQNRHGGNLRSIAESAGIAARDLLDFSANINPLGPPEWLRPVLSSAVSSLAHYPDPDCAGLTRAASEAWGVAGEEILTGNGSTEILYLLPRILDARRALVLSPAYVDYARASELAGLSVESVLLRESDDFRPDVEHLATQVKAGDLVFIGQPNNPTGQMCDTKSLRSMARQHREAFFVIDEAFIDFVEDADSLIHDRPANVIVLRSLTKFYAIPGLRLGCAVCDADLANRVRAIMPPWSVNTLAQVVGENGLLDADYAAKTVKFVKEQREALTARMHEIAGLKVYPGAANFLLVRLTRDDIDAAALAEAMIRDGVAIRVCSNFEGLGSQYFRVAVRTEAENARMIESLRAALQRHAPAAHTRVKTPAVMFQGTSSNAGKSVLVAAMCRILLQDGYRVAPFKAQNMSLNSYATRDGGEMGRAQVVQAQASRLDPEVRMNPVLLKPNSDTGSQVIVLGKPVANMEVGQYFRYKQTAFDTVKQAYDSLSSEYDAIVLEGAGSPGEVNLKSHDIVNMRMAEYAQAPVLLVGDIDRGGVFASFVGTMEVLAEWERNLMAGFVINRFRGKESLLQDAIDYTQRHTGLPTFGVVPYLKNLGLPEEDSVAFKSGLLDDSAAAGDRIEVAVVDLPHISNFTDFDPFRIEPDVFLRIVRNGAELGSPDVVILPGSKNVIGDLTYLVDSGLASKIAELVRAGQTEVVGVCGGFQMLGGEIADPHGLESRGQTLKGLGILPVTTTLEQEKTLRSVGAKHAASGLPLRGYEIHHGQTTGMTTPTVIREDGEIIGTGLPNGMVWGTYLHGIFDADGFRRWFIDRLRARRGMAPFDGIAASYDLEPALDRLADAVRQSMRIKDIYRIMGLA